MRHVAVILFILALSASSFVVRVPVQGAAQDSGNEYVSGTYGFRVTWDDRLWYVVDQRYEQGWEEIALSDGVAFVFFSAGFGYGGRVQPCVDATAQSVVRTPGVDGFVPLAGGDGQPVQGEEDDRAFAAYTYAYRFGDGVTIDFVRYVECRVLVAGESVVIADVVVPAPVYDDEFPLAQEVIANLTLPSPGEPAPVFVSERWRLAIVAAERGRRIRAANLSPRTGRDWLVVVVDATNWGSSDDELGARDFRLRLDGAGEPVRLALASTVAAAAELGTGPASAREGVPIPPGRTRRLTLVFQIPREAAGPALVRAGSALPLDDVLAAGTNLDDLPPTLGPPFLREARVDGVLNGELLRITFLSDDSTAVLRLVGSDAPGPSDCYGQDVAAAIGRVVGKTVRIEREPGAPIDASVSGYLWTDTPSGVPVLFNQQLVADGFAAVTIGERDARFGAWLVESERVAKADKTGFWSECTGPHGRPLATPVAA